MALDIPSYLMGAIKSASSAGVKYVVVQELPTTGEEGTIYLVPKSTSQTDNVYNEYMYINNDWELIGDTQADLSNYQEKLVSGTNIKTINNNSVLGSGNLDTEIIQYSTMPTASASTVNKIVQYTGTTDNTYTNGYFYKGAEDNGVYSWGNINVQENSGGASTTIGIDLDSYTSQDNKTKLKYIYDNISNLDFSTIYGYDYNSNDNNVYFNLIDLYKDSNRLYLFFERKYYNNNGYDTTNNDIEFTKRDYKPLEATIVNDVVTSISMYTFNEYMFYGNMSYRKVLSKYTLFSLSGLSGFSTSSTYNVGDYVMKKSDPEVYIYRCKEAITTAGNWDNSKWEIKSYKQYLTDMVVDTALSSSY